MQISSCFNLEKDKNGFSFHINLFDLTEEDVKALHERTKMEGVSKNSMLLASSVLDFIELSAMYTILVNKGNSEDALQEIRNFFLLVVGQEMLRKVDAISDLSNQI